MSKPGLTAFFRTEQIQEKILVEQALAEAGIEFQVDAPGNLTTNAIYQERGPWEFYTNSDRLREAEELVRMLPADNLLTAPQETPRTTTAQKSWAWFVIVITAAMISAIILIIMKSKML